MFRGREQIARIVVGEKAPSQITRKHGGGVSTIPKVEVSATQGNRTLGDMGRGIKLL